MFNMYQILLLSILTKLGTACTASYPHLLHEKYYTYYEVQFGQTTQFIALNIFLETGCGSTFLSLDTGSTTPSGMSAQFASPGGVSINIHRDTSAPKDPFAVAIWLNSGPNVAAYFTIMIWP